MNDFLRDRLADAARHGTSPMAPADRVRAGAEHRRARHRAFAAATAAAVLVVAAAVAGSAAPWKTTQPATPATETPTESSTQSTTPTATPTATPTQTTAALPPRVATTDPGPSDADIQATLADFRFEDEEDWLAQPDFPMEISTEPTRWALYWCETTPQAGPDRLLGMRTVTKPWAHTAERRQLAVFENADAAQSAMTDLRAAVRSCQEQAQGTRTLDEGGGEYSVEHSFVGEQLSLGDESFWTARRLVVVEGNDIWRVGLEQESTATLFVLDQNVILIASGPAVSPHLREFGPPTREAWVVEASAEYERARERYAAALR